MEDIFVTWFESMTTLHANDGSIRIGYQEQGAPNFDIKDNILCFSISPLNTIYGQDVQIEEQSESISDITMNRTQIFTQSIRLSISLYGPSNLEIAETLWAQSRLADKRVDLTRNEIYPIAKPRRPLLANYKLNNQWWRRADLTLDFNVLSKVSDQVNSLASADVTIQTEKEGQE